jgi:hypothetical protein
MNSELKQRAIAEGEALADRLAAAIVLERSWFSCITESSASVRRVVAGLTTDPALADELARVCADAARTRLDALLERSQR